MPEVRLAASALDDLADILRYYQGEGVPDVGGQLVAKIFTHIEQLADHPDIGRVVPEFDKPNLRELIHPPFRIVYRRESKYVNIVRVWRSERLLQLAEK